MTRNPGLANRFPRPEGVKLWPRNPGLANRFPGPEGVKLWPRKVKLAKRFSSFLATSQNKKWPSLAHNPNLSQGRPHVPFTWSGKEVCKSSRSIYLVCQPEQIFHFARFVFQILGLLGTQSWPYATVSDLHDQQHQTQSTSRTVNQTGPLKAFSSPKPHNVKVI